MKEGSFNAVPFVISTPLEQTHPKEVFTFHSGNRLGRHPVFSITVTRSVCRQLPKLVKAKCHKKP